MLGVVIEKPDLPPLVKKWQAILRLEDWDIRIQYVRTFELESNHQGEITYIRTKKKASIKILDPTDFPTTRPEDTWPQDIEKTVVHELLHIHFALVDDYEKTSLQLFEQAIDAISEALVNLDRRRLKGC